MFVCDYDYFKSIFNDMKKIYIKYTKEFSKYGDFIDGESSIHSSEIYVNLPYVSIYPFDEKHETVIGCDKTNELEYEIKFPKCIYDDEELENINNGLEIISICKSLYKNFLNEIKELFEED